MVVRGTRMLIVCAALAVSVLGCSDPYRFTIASSDPVDCRVFTALHSVERVPYGFQMKPNSVVGMTSLEYTQFIWRGIVRTHGGEGFALLLRPTIEETVRDSGLILHFYTSGGMALDSANTRLERNPAFRFPQDSNALVTIYNDEDFLQVTVGCDTVLRRHSMRMESDDLGIRSGEGTEVTVLGPVWKQHAPPIEMHVRSGRDL
ncbi:MAG: hypothetical protein JSS75_13230 [Bacteroidetes bacterium]|nr:hypothetical protein [Bacteroidota bacterium]